MLVFFAFAPPALSKFAFCDLTQQSHLKLSHAPRQFCTDAAQLLTRISGLSPSHQSCFPRCNNSTALQVEICGRSKTDVLLRQVSGIIISMFERLFRRASAEDNKNIPQVAAGDRIYAVGDIHGRLDLLKALIDKIAEDAAGFDDDRQAQLIFLGDYIDRGDQSSGVLDVLLAIQSVKNVQCRFLAGNHEVAMLAFLEDPIKGADWIEWGGRQTLTSYGLPNPSREPPKEELQAIRDALYAKAEDHLPFLQALELYAVSGQVVFAHASLDPAVALDVQSERALLWGQVGAGASSGLPGYRLVHGHFDDREPVVRPDRICVDTGAYYSGRLTAARLDEDVQFLTVDTRGLMP